MTELKCWNAATELERPAVIQARDRLAAAELGDEMEPGAYAALEAHMWRHPLARAGMRVFASTEGERILASFETWPVEVRVREEGGIARYPGAIGGSTFVAGEA